MLEHGGDLDLALRHFGGRLDDWIDLSTGINRRPYPVPQLAPRHWSALPSRTDIDALHARMSDAAHEIVRGKWSLDASIDALERRLSVAVGNMHPDPRRNEVHEDSVLACTARGSG